MELSFCYWSNGPPCDNRTSYFECHVRFYWQKVYPRFIHRYSEISITPWFTNVWKFDPIHRFIRVLRNIRMQPLSRLNCTSHNCDRDCTERLWCPNLESCQEFEWSIFFLTLCLRCWRPYSATAAACCILLGVFCYSSSRLMMIVSTDCFVVYQFHIHQQRFSIRTGCTGCFASRWTGFRPGKSSWWGALNAKSDRGGAATVKEKFKAAVFQVLN